MWVKTDLPIPIIWGLEALVRMAQVLMRKPRESKESPKRVEFCVEGRSMAIATTPPLSQHAIIDTNVFIYALYPARPEYQAALHLRELAQQPDAVFYATPQILAEFYSTGTNPRRITPSLSINQALQEVENIQALARLILLPITAYRRGCDTMGAASESTPHKSQ